MTILSLQNCRSNVSRSKTYETYGAQTFSNIEDWRRDNVNQLVRDLNTAIKNKIIREVWHQSVRRVEKHR